MEIKIDLSSRDLERIKDVLGITDYDDIHTAMVKALDRMLEIEEIRDKTDDNEDYENDGPRNLELNGLFFKCTCHSCPEQYDVFTAAGEQVGYVRLRHGSLYAEYPDVGGECVYDTYAFAGDGYFRNDKERLYHLENIADALMAKKMEEWSKRRDDLLEDTRE